MNSEPGAPLRPKPEVKHLLLRAENLSKSYARNGRQALELFHDLTFSVETGQMVAIIGPSGAGKSTLLHLLGALARPSAGEIWLGETALSRLQGESAALFRNREVGYVWQFHYLLPEFTAVENVAMPLAARGMRPAETRKAAAEWLERVGLGDRLDHQAGELSGGEEQRVSVARALITRPQLLLADEPTGDLDELTARTVFDLIRGVHRDERLTTVLVTHNTKLARQCDRVLRLSKDGLHELPGAEV